MKKILLTTSALVGAAAIATSAFAGGEPAGIMAGGLAVTIGGQIDFQSGFSSQDVDGVGEPGSRSYKFQNDTELHFNVEGKTENGLKYGAVIELNADVNLDADSDGTNADKTYIFVETSAGRVELGNTAGVEQTMEVSAGTIARATGGIDGDFYDFIDIAPGATTVIATPDLPSDNEPSVHEDATKIAYYSPKFNGFQVGLHFTPDTGLHGTATSFGNNSDTDADQYENVFGAGLSYEGDVNGVAVAASIVGEFGEAENAADEDLQAYQVGASAAYQGFTVAASYGDWQETDGANTDATFWTAGVAYETGPFGVSVTYMDSEIDNDDFQNIVLGADYQLAPGLVPYVEVAFFDVDGSTAGAANDNDGSVVLLGAELTF